MHEASLARNLLRQVAALLRDAEGEAVETVFVEIGPLAGVEPALLASAFDEQVGTTTVAGARLVIDEAPLEAECGCCGAQVEIRDFSFHCSVCGSVDLRVTRGDAVMLKSVDVRFAEASAGETV